MRAMVLEQPKDVHEKPLRLTEAPTPAPGPGEVLVRVRACGVCRTDLHIVEGELPIRAEGIIPGHQVVGTVEALGEGATRFSIGERLGLAWLHRTCCACRFCGRGDENLCERAAFTGYDANGGYAEFTTIHEDFAYRLPGDLPDSAAAPLLCAGIIGYRTLRLSGIQPGEKLGLWGFGAAAHITIQIAQHWGCRVYVFTRGESRRRLGLKMGAVWAGDADDDPGTKLDGSCVFAPAGPLVPRALELTQRGGAVALGGIYMSTIPEMDYTQHLYHERQLRSVMNATREDGRELLRLAVEIPIETKVTTFPLEETNEALMALKDGSIDGAAVIRVAE
jgi:alcohol dehydrogenase, propanol-preferring